MQAGQNAFTNPMLTNLSDISYNDTDKHNRNTNYDAEILNGSDAALQMPTDTKR